ncbi:MAG: helix-turn-helix domain-containing protein [Chthoniobacterales bacterium]
MEPLGKKLQEARLAKKISLEEASRVTKIRAARIQELEAEDFSSFSSLAYAKGFLLIYGKYLNVDVTPYLDAFETSREVSVDGYSYLQEAPGAAPPPIVRRQPVKRPALFPFIIALGVLVLGLYLVKLLLNIQRITPTHPVPAALASATATPIAALPVSPAENIVAPRALSAEGTPASKAHVTVTPSPHSSAEPEVRRAIPVHPEDLASPPNEAATAVNQVEITPVRLTYVRVRIEGRAEPVFDDWLDPSHPPLSFRGRHIVMRVLDRGAVQITKNGAALAPGDEDITFE